MKLSILIIDLDRGPTKFSGAGQRSATMTLSCSTLFIWPLYSRNNTNVKQDAIYASLCSASATYISKLICSDVITSSLMVERVSLPALMTGYGEK